MSIKDGTSVYRGVMLCEKLDAALLALADKEGKSMSWVMRKAMIEFLARRGTLIGTADNPRRGERLDLRKKKRGLL